MNCYSCKRKIEDNSLYCNWCGVKQIRVRKKRKSVSVPEPVQLPSGSWRIQLRKENISITESSYTECKSKALAYRMGYLEEAEARAKNGPTVREALADYIEAREGESGRSPSTIDGYDRKARNNLQMLMDMPVASLTTEIVQKAVNQDKKKYSGKTIHEAVSLLGSATGKRFPELVMPSKMPKKKPPVYSSDDLRKLLLALNSAGGQTECAGLLAVWCSLRRSEIFGLKWTDIKDSYLIIRTARVYDKNHKLVEKDTKNTTSERSIPCPAYLLERINALPHTSEYVFTDSTSGIWKGITTACNKAGIEHGYLHGFRHTNATVMEKLGVPAKYSNHRGGWASDHVRVRRYTDIMDEEYDAVGESIDSYFESLIFCGPPLPPGFKRQNTHEITHEK